LPVTLTAGTVHTEIVISKPGDGIEIINLVDTPRATGLSQWISRPSGRTPPYHRSPSALPAPRWP
jgi:hypothetical protein